MESSPGKECFPMKFNEMTYTRPDIGALLARCKELAAKAAAAPDGDALVRLYYEQSEAFAEYNTAANLANIHYTCDTRDRRDQRQRGDQPRFPCEPACRCPDREVRHHLCGRYEECRSGHG